MKSIVLCTWKKVDGRFVCQAKHCPHWSKDGCKLGKVSLSCDRDDCRWNIKGGHRCITMDVHLDADGKCLGFEDES